ncbi:alpha-N-acetylgalactosamine-specific lectin-like [Dreissena polymorpha]|uniref:C-type lectin domain-containing protein n=1 Tax=Dreissena polymorpha TaxID=45954 RepID=A0A9D4BKR0_DREPO|nr:alpha-N-acetylgalactosamine-specific lectin-like [Dreissena polymorpha]XP_052257923.1 alpha-N-acetylgalactosamine-specific lectin-like [Dreissena polymorpha]KAH3698439.1 hypothetical protein DPMN_085959 [Dreissena polymorpha]
MQYYRETSGIPSGDPVLVLQTDNTLHCALKCNSLAVCQAFRFANRTCELFNASFVPCHGSGCFAVFTADGWPSCPDGWLVFEGSCFMFGNSSANFTAAQNFCKSHGGNLIHVNSAPENDFVRSHARTLQGRFWLALNQPEEGHWIWVDTNTTDTFLGWAPNEPDWSAGECAVFEGQKDYQWADYPCVYNDVIPLCEISGE